MKGSNLFAIRFLQWRSAASNKKRKKKTDSSLIKFLRDGIEVWKKLSTVANLALLLAENRHVKRLQDF